jgi:transposase
MFFDEARFGTNTKLGYGWFEQGKRTQVKIKIGYQSFYLYSAINHKSGSNFSIMLPRVDTINMNKFLEELSNNCKNKKIALILDGAGWHKSKDLKVPENIEIFMLPPYSPELNPVERFWAYVKKNILYNRLYESLDEIENTLNNFFDGIHNDIICKICHVNYLNNQ